MHGGIELPLWHSVLSVVKTYLAFFTNCRKSVPVISFGSFTSSIPRMVGEISRNDPPDFSVNCFAFAETTMNGTGLVVCAVCGPPVAGSIISSALP